MSKTTRSALRLLLGVVIAPVIAGAWLVIYALLVGLGAMPTQTAPEVFLTGLAFGAMIVLVWAWEALR